MNRPAPQTRFKVYLEFEGTRYSGWQVQTNARTVQGELIVAAKKLFGTETAEWYGSGRTDAGVHALCQVAHLEVKTMLGPEIIRKKLNDILPSDINILEVEKTSRNFHARHDAVLRSYLYQLSRRRTAFGKRYVWWVKDVVDVKKMQEAAALFAGMKDMRSFTSDDPEEKSTNVLLEGITIKEVGELILIRIEGSHFLWKLVRQIVGVLVEAGKGKLELQEITKLFTTESELPATLTAPASGLFLERVYYAGDMKLEELEPAVNITRNTWLRSV